jgi:hypothetical protein
MICRAVANPVAEAMSPVNNQVQNIVNNHAVILYVNILTTVLVLVSIICFVLVKCSCKQPRLNPL